MSKIKLAVIMGGMSEENEISLQTGKEIIKNLDKRKYIIYPVFIDRSGKGIENIINIKPDLAFIALHGKGGEDGKIQGFLESLNIKYTGSGVTASAVGMNKILFMNIMKANNIDVPESFIVERKTDSIDPLFDPPYFVKPFDGGSSVGAGFASCKKDLINAVKIAFKHSEKVIVEKYVKGLEVSCGVLGNSKPKALPVIEIHPLKSDFFDYTSKYQTKGSNEIVPAKIPLEITNKIQKLSEAIYKIIGCSGYARVDYILENNVNPIVLEINTLPGMTPTSLFPKEALAAGMSYSKVLDVIIDYANKK